MTEEWKNVENTDGKYTISNFGRVKSYIRNKEGYLMKNTLQKRGYYTVGINKKTSYIHVLVWEHFGDKKRTDIGCCKKGENKNPKLLQIDHIDNNRLNNRIDNLQLLTYIENSYKKRKDKPIKKYKNKRIVKGEQRKYRCQFSFEGKLTYLGIFHTKEEVKKYKEDFKNNRYKGKVNIYYPSQLSINGKIIHLGWFKNKEDAEKKVSDYKKKLF